MCLQMCTIVCVSKHREKKKKKIVSVCLVIYDAILVINTALLSHFDALIDTCTGGAYGPGTRAQSLTVPT